jgi:diphthamide synthase (EF-2-diphthine--ammonia ligase)
MGTFVATARAAGVHAMAFGDLFLADIRAYRERQLADTGITPHFPLWGRDTPALAREMIDGGLVAHITCVDAARLDRSFAGRRFDHAFLTDLPGSADPCGENGEFHTFVSAGPMFGTPLAVGPGAVTERDGFVFADLLPAA